MQQGEGLQGRDLTNIQPHQLLRQSGRGRCHPRRAGAVHRWWRQPGWLGALALQILQDTRGFRENLGGETGQPRYVQAIALTRPPRHQLAQKYHPLGGLAHRHMEIFDPRDQGFQSREFMKMRRK